MAWQTSDVIGAGQYVMVEIVGGVNLDIASTITAVDVAQAVAARAVGWSVLSAEWERGLFGFSETLRIFGRATAQIPSASVRMQVETGVNGFWAIASADAVVFASDDYSIPQTQGNAWAGSLQMVAIAVIVVAVVWGIKQVKEIAK